MHLSRHTAVLILVAFFSILLAGCQFDTWFKKPAPQPGRLQAVRFVDPVQPIASDDSVSIRGARNETVSFAFQVNKFPQKLEKKDALRLSPLSIGPKGGTIPLTACSAYQVLPMPIDANRAGFVRHTGLSVSSRRFPRALLPLPLASGSVNLSSFRSPESPTDPAAKPQPSDSSSPIVWIDIQIPPTVPAGVYQAKCELVEDGEVTGLLPIKLTVDDFVLPDERHLLMVGTVDWASLQRLYPDSYRALQPQYLSRREPKYANAIKLLDQLVKQAQAHRMQLVIPELQPLVKWPFGQGPQIDWADYDSIVTPWLKGDLFADNVPLAFWPLPRIDKLDTHDQSSRMEYWQAASSHFDAFDWLSRSAIPVESQSPGRASLAQSVEMSKEAARLLTAHPNVRVMLPLEEEQVQTSTPDLPGLIQAGMLNRIIYLAPGLVSRAPIQRLPEGNGSRRYLRCEDSPQMPYVGAGADVREVRMWAFLAFLRDAQNIQWPSVLPAHSRADTPGDPGQLVWFYPGEWFGVSNVVPTVQLKWLRRAEQDYEYLYLARQRGQLKRAQTLARLIAKPIELQAMQTADPAFALLSGTSQEKAWDDVAALLTRTILLSQPGQSADPVAERQLSFDAAAWSSLQARPLLIGRTVEWGAGIRDDEGTNWLNVRLGLDIYNAADRQPDTNSVQWAVAPEGWSIRKDPAVVPMLAPFSINRAVLEGRIAANRISVATRKPIKVSFQDGYSGKPYTIDLVVPVARCEKLEGASPEIDGYLGDWSADDALHDGKLVQMLSRPLVQRQELEYAPTDSSVYSSWSSGYFYLGFKVDRASTASSNAESNFVRYEFRRAWGEDICEILVQPVYSDNSVGPLLHIACKPRGQAEISRRLNPRFYADPWQAFASTDTRYFARLDNSIWRGELAIPWEVMKAPGEEQKKIALLRFNFIQHYGATGQSASWAGPIDSGRNEAFTGLLQLHSTR